MKLFLFLAFGFVLFASVLAWPDLRTDWDYWQAKRTYARLHVGEPKAQVKKLWGLPVFAQYDDQCWTDSRSRWPGGERTYTFCFAHGKLVSKSFSDG